MPEKKEKTHEELAAEETRKEKKRQEKERANLEKARARSRANRWTAKTKSRVEHPKHGSVIVPHLSKLAAIENAAEFWKCDVREIISDAQVWAVSPAEGPVRRPKEFYSRKQTEQNIEKTEEEA